MSEFFTLSVLVATFASAVRLAVPYLLAALGETIGQRSGVLNLGVDGVMLLSAFGAYYTVLQTESHTLGILVGLLVGLFMGLVYGVVTVVLHAEQGISGIGIFLFGLGFSDLLFEELVGTATPLPVSLPRLRIPLLGDIPHVGNALFNHTLAAYGAFLAVPLVTLLLTRTTFGLNVRSVGENPEAADSLGVSVARTRFLAILVGNGFAGLAGAGFILGLGIFQQNITQGLGFIAVALVYFGAWRSHMVMAGALLYGVARALVEQMKVRGIIPLEASEFFNTMPAVLVIVALVFLAGRVDAPSALTRPFSRH